MLSMCMAGNHPQDLPPTNPHSARPMAEKRCPMLGAPTPHSHLRRRTLPRCEHLCQLRMVHELHGFVPELYIHLALWQRHNAQCLQLRISALCSDELHESVVGDHAIKREARPCYDSEAAAVCSQEGAVLRCACEASTDSHWSAHAHLLKDLEVHAARHWELE